MIPMAIDESMRGFNDLLSSITKIKPAKIRGNKNIVTHTPYALSADKSKNVLPKLCLSSTFSISVKYLTSAVSDRAALLCDLH